MKFRRLEVYLQVPGDTIGTQTRSCSSHGSLILGMRKFNPGRPISSLTLSNCGTAGSQCPAATYSFDVGSTSASLTIQITGPVTSGLNNYITGVNLGFTSQAINVTNFASAPAGTWTNSDFTASLSNNGCGTNNGTFVCASGSGVQIGQGGTYVFTWTYDPIVMNQVYSANDIHIGTNYGPHNGLIV